MSNPSLYAELCAVGGMAIIPEDLCRDHHIRRVAVWIVLTHLALAANRAAEVRVSVSKIARQLGIERWQITGAIAVLRAARLFVPAGDRMRIVIDEDASDAN